MLGKAKRTVASIDKSLGAYLMAVLSLTGFGARVRGAARGLGHDARGQLGFRTIVAAVIVVITVSLGVIVVDQFDQSLGDPQSSDLSTAQNDVLSGFSDMTSLVGPLLLVAIAVVIIGLVQRIRSS